MGYFKRLKNVSDFAFDYSTLKKRFEKMVIEEEKKKERKDEKLLVDLYECIQLHNTRPASDDFLSVCVPFLIKVALNREGNEETRKEVEIALLTLSNVGQYTHIEKEQFLSEINGIIKHHQAHHNLTQLAYQSAWQFFVSRLFYDESLEDIIVNELHFGREAASEMKELSKSVSWKRKKEEEEKKEEKGALIIGRWLYSIEYYLSHCKMWNGEHSELIGCIVKMFQASRDNYKEIHVNCLYLFRKSIEKKNVKIEDLLNEGAIDLCSDEMKRSILNVGIAWECLLFFLNVSMRLKEEDDDETKEAKRKELKRKIYEKMEEKGYEDSFVSFYGVILFLHGEYQDDDLSLNVEDYFANV
ncbi:uncharacterized protein MONOS_17867 [Monocercomonoides exilis]|uniref:uncharacterized protein n=1 Tax=Monocercomonoides exilis TaxID=2049356 RepID=UPI00355A3498|nr:hypothetical protein MONOS_17867 [Monocercomonoides exilis]